MIKRTLGCAVLAVFFAGGCDWLASDPAAEGGGPAKTAVRPPMTGLGQTHGAGDPHSALGPEKLLEVAFQHDADGRPGEAMDVLSRAIVAYPDHAGLLGARGALYLQQNRYSAALSDLEAAARLAPTAPAVLTNRAQAYRQFERIDEALADLDRAIEIKPNFIPAHFNRGTILFTRGEYRRALDDFDRCIAVDPHLAAPYFNRAVTQDALGEVERAIADLERFLQLADDEDWKGAAREILARWRARPAGGAAIDSGDKKGG